MRGIFLVSCFLGGSALLAGCREENNSPRPATEDAARITSARQWGESRSALQKRELDRAAGPALPIPDDLPSRELVGTTRQIHQLIEASGNPARFESYTETVPAAGASLRMVAIPGGTFLMGSPAEEPHRKPDEGPQHKVSISPFWISETEIPWELYTAFMENGRPRAKDGQLLEEQPDDELWDSVTQPTAPYTAMNLGMGHGYEHGLPAISMSHHAASKFCEWLSAQTGHYYRLPTEAEWEYACRAGSPILTETGKPLWTSTPGTGTTPMTATRKQALKNQISGDSGTCTEMWRNGFWTLTFRMPTANGAACPRKTPWSSSPAPLTSFAAVRGKTTRTA